MHKSIRGLGSHKQMQSEQASYLRRKVALGQSRCDRQRRGLLLLLGPQRSRMQRRARTPRAEPAQCRGCCQVEDPSCCVRARTRRADRPRAARTGPPASMLDALRPAEYEHSCASCSQCDARLHQWRIFVATREDTGQGIETALRSLLL